MVPAEKKDRKIQVVMSEELYATLVECMEQDKCANVSEEVRFLIQMRNYRDSLIDEIMGRVTSYLFPRLEQDGYKVFQSYLESPEFSDKLQYEISRYFDRLEQMVKKDDKLL
jgi:hypothetical protein